VLFYYFNSTITVIPSHLLACLFDKRLQHKKECTSAKKAERSKVLSTVAFATKVCNRLLWHEENLNFTPEKPSNPAPVSSFNIKKTGNL
jgi:hypothetical protein